MQVWKHLTEWEFATIGFKGQPVGLVILRLSSHQLCLHPPATLPSSHPEYIDISKCIDYRSRLSLGRGVGRNGLILLFVGGGKINKGAFVWRTKPKLLVEWD